MVNECGAYYDLHRYTKKFKIYIVRNNDFHDHYQDSQPCIHCQEVLRKMNFGKVIYTNSDGSVENLKTKDLHSNHHSIAQRKLDAKTKMGKFLPIR